jgi:undecaprenyl diphosphate synthase
MEATKNNRPKQINFAMAYGGREEIIDAVKKVLSEGRKEINEEEFGNYLWLNSAPDLIIRTGGEQRTSNFLPWQSTYSEWIFLDKFWPEIEKEDLVKCIEEYKSRERRFGK